MIRRLDPRPGLRFTSSAARAVEPDVYITKDGDDYLIQLNDEDSSTAPSECAVPPHARSRE